MSATAGLTSDLQKQVLLLEDDLRFRVQSDPQRLSNWQAEHAEAVKRERTESSWVEWRDDRVTQSAVAWVLTTVFVRFCEDNALVKPVWIAGPASRRQEALDAQLAFFRAHPEDTDREWLRETVDYLAGLPSTATLVDSHSALHLVSPSGDAATRLLSFWRRKDDAGQLVHDLSDSTLSTRFLGDLYQDLSEYAKKTFALLQTPVFVEEFILDRTLEPALAERPLEGFKVIDPTCGSGHFLLGTFERLLARWDKLAPGLEVQARVQQALNSIHGVDLNPFAVAISRFRLTVAALQACGMSSLERAPAFNFHLAAGDSLLHGQDQYSMSYDDFDPDSALSGFAYATEDLALLREILQPGRYDAVVGNPPYITVKDPTLGKAYREIYKTCKGKYALTVPFMERFLGLAKSGNENQPAGWSGQITSNSFMKREFGSKLVEKFLPHKDLRLVADTSQVYFSGDGFGTQTVILVARNQPPVGSTVRAVLGVRGEPGRPVDAANGIVWRTIVEHVDEPGWDGGWVTIADLDRTTMARHPWSLSGGGAVGLLAEVERVGQRKLVDLAKRIGVFGITAADDAMMVDVGVVRRHLLERAATAPLVVGEQVRDFRILDVSPTWFPYDEKHQLKGVLEYPGWARWLWRQRTELGNRATFTKGTYFSDGRPWWEWHQLPKDIGVNKRTITLAFVATHNHFVLDRGGKVFSRTAPIIKLPVAATEEDHLALLGVLNSSTICFWLRQRSHAHAHGVGAPWEVACEFAGATVSDIPLPSKLPLERGSLLDRLASELERLTPSALAAREVPNAEALGQVRTRSQQVREQMIAVQEELDWEVYRLYELVSDDLNFGGDELPGLALGERAFEISLARMVAAGDEETAWFTRHGSEPITEVPSHWPAGYSELVQRRLDLIANDRAIGLLEKPEHKRRWAGESWEKQQEKALCGWLLDRLEDKRFWFDTQGRPQPRSVAQLADDVARDSDLVSVLSLWEERPDVPVSDSLVRLLAGEGVPYLAAYRLKDSGLRKREAWEQTWALQRREDAGGSVGTIPVPPKYTSADFIKASWWQARGKLDAPKERFILYPDAGRDTDPTPLLGWAGWDHAQQSLALSLVIGAREADGWEDDRLVPLVAGLAELQPWVEQWHAEVDPTYGVSLAAFCREQQTARASQVGKSLEELAAWRPQPSLRGRKPKKGGVSS